LLAAIDDCCGRQPTPPIPLEMGEGSQEPPPSGPEGPPLSGPHPDSHRAEPSVPRRKSGLPQNERVRPPLGSLNAGTRM
jgi:hypothetical protein